MIEVKHVAKSYHHKFGIENISMKIERGTIHGLVGENGAGKTTLIKCMTGIYPVDAGEILYDGVSVYENPVIKGKIAYVADSNEYLGFYSVSRLVSLFEILYPNFNKNRFGELNEIFHVNLKRMVSSLSKGQKMRLAFMLAIASETEYLILDEPTSGLDVIAKKKLLEILVEEVEKREPAVLISTHNLMDLEHICDEITMLKRGCVTVQNSMDGLKDSLEKIQVVFEQGAPLDLHRWKEIVDVKNVGSIYTLIVKQNQMDDTHEIKEKLRNAGAGFMEVLPISLEELFIYTNQEDETYEAI